MATSLSRIFHVLLLLTSLPPSLPVPVVDGGPYPLTPNKEGGVEYGVVVDAGSSGSRARVYTWPDEFDPGTVPDIQETYWYKEEPGISEFVDNLDGLDPYIRNLVSMAADNVPEEKHSDTVIYFMATAGMRLLLEDRANEVMDRINSLLLDGSVNPFSYEALNTRILSGEEEGAFAWISVNYLNGFFDRRANDPDEVSAGLLEMGGASLQIAFQPEGSILADKFPVKVGGAIYPVYVHSYLYYGQDYADLWVKQYLYDVMEEKDNITDNITNPCMLKEDTITEEIREHNVTYIGSGDPDECMEILDVYVYHVDPRRCHPKPCSIGAVYQPSIIPQQDFFAVGAFIYPLRLLEVLEADGGFNLVETNSSAYNYCFKDIWTVQKETNRTDPYLSVECLTGLYIPKLLVKGFQFDYDTAKLRAVDEINDEPTEWTLGAIIYENERRDWQCPKLEDSGAVLRSTSPLALLAGLMFCLLSQMPSDSLHNATTTRDDFVVFFKTIK